MTVYVDQMMNNLWKLHGKYVKNCHMWSDNTTQELLDFVEKIGLKKEWVQKSRIGWVHFDLVESYREKAVKNGAVPITNRQAGKMIIEYRKKERKSTHEML